MADDLTFGNVDGFPPGSTFASRSDLSKARVHRPTQAGIAGSALRGGADSIVVSGGYEDDEDFGSEIIYTGHGGHDPYTRSQVADQDPHASGNRALAYNRQSGNPVRVVRGARGDPKYSPSSGYRYDGLFKVEEHWMEKGSSGFSVVRFRMTELADDEVRDFHAPLPPESAPPGRANPSRTWATITKVVRDSVLTRWVKERHKYRCQFCGDLLVTPSGLYAEGAHIRPLGRAHSGPDVVENILCLCPNHHVLFDAGAISVRSDGTLIGMSGVLRTARGHNPDRQHLEYHRSRILVDRDT